MEALQGILEQHLGASTAALSAILRDDIIWQSDLDRLEIVCASFAALMEGYRDLMLDNRLPSRLDTIIR